MGHPSIPFYAALIQTDSGLSAEDKPAGRITMVGCLPDRSP